FGCGSRVTNLFRASVCSFNCAVTSSTACFRVRRKKMANPSRPTATTPPTTKEKFFFNQFMSKLDRVLQLQIHPEAEGYRVRGIHLFDVAGEFGFLAVKHRAGLQSVLDGEGQLVVGRWVIV